MRDTFCRRLNEQVADHAERLCADPWFEHATAAELAAFVGCSREDAQRARRNFFRRHRAMLVFEHAQLIAERVHWPFDTSALITLALERYAERFNTNVTQSAGGCTAEGASRVKGLDGGSRKAAVASEGMSQTVEHSRSYTPEASHQPSDGFPPPL